MEGDPEHIKQLQRFILRGGKIPVSIEYLLSMFNQTPTPTPTPTPVQDYLAGFTGNRPSKEIESLIVDSAKKYGIDPRLFAALLYQESTFDPTELNPNVGGRYGPDYGIAQINLKQHPGVTQQQAYDPKFAIPWAAEYLAGDIKHFNDINRGVAAYNVGRGGASVKGPEKFGGGPKGQRYINNVSRNLNEDVLKELGLITNY